MLQSLVTSPPESLSWSDIWADISPTLVDPSIGQELLGSITMSCCSSDSVIVMVTHWPICEWRLWPAKLDLDIIYDMSGVSWMSTGIGLHAWLGEGEFIMTLSSPFGFSISISDSSFLFAILACCLVSLLFCHLFSSLLIRNGDILL